MEQYLQILLSQHTFKVKNHRHHNCHHNAIATTTLQKQALEKRNSEGTSRPQEFFYTAVKQQGSIKDK